MNGRSDESRALEERTASQRYWLTAAVHGYVIQFVSSIMLVEGMQQF